MGRQQWIAVASLAVLAGCAEELSNRERIVERQIVETRLDTWARLVNNAARDSLLALYHQGDDLKVIWPEGRQTTGREETQTAWRDFYARTDYMNFVLQSPTVELLSPTVALVTFRHSTDIVRSGRRQPVRAGYGTLVWKKDPEDGLWKIYLSQVAYDAAE